MKNTIENKKKKSGKYCKCNEKTITKAETQIIPIFKR